MGKLGGDFDKADYFDLAKLPPELREDHREVLRHGEVEEGRLRRRINRLARAYEDCEAR